MKKEVWEQWQEEQLKVLAEQQEEEAKRTSPFSIDSGWYHKFINTTTEAQKKTLIAHGFIDPGTRGPTPCSHIWGDYVGFRESYHYCTVCDEKKAMKG